VLSLFVAEEKDRHYKLNAKRKRIKRQITVHKILHRKLKLNKTNPMNNGEGTQVPRNGIHFLGHL
jgi:hypothetical protein